MIFTMAKPCTVTAPAEAAGHRMPVWATKTEGFPFVFTRWKMVVRVDKVGEVSELYGGNLGYSNRQWTEAQLCGTSRAKPL